MTNLTESTLSRICHPEQVELCLESDPATVERPGSWPNPSERIDVTNRTCSIEGCSRKHLAQGYCSRHYRQFAARPKCSVEACESRVHAHGLCELHHALWRKSGSPLVTNWVVGERLDWLKDAIANRDRNGCWDWPYGRDQHGYGRLQFRGRKMKAHHVALILDGRERPPAPANHTLHSCDNPPCVNPAHLRWGTLEDNNAEKVHRDRQRGPSGEKCWTAKLTKEDVLAIRADARRYKDIAASYGITEQHASRIHRGKAWSHL